jgi:hypothetical protein
MKSGSAILLNGVLLLLLITMGASLWFLLPTAESLDQARSAAANSTVITPAATPVEDLSARWRAQLTNADGELRSWRQKKEQMASELAKMAPDGGSESPVTAPDEQDAHKLAEVLARRRAELERLQLTLGADQPSAEGTLTHGHKSTVQRREPVWLQLYGNRVLPVDERYYSVRTVDAGGIAFRVLRRTSAGETYREAEGSGSKLQLALRGVVPEKQYLQCLVSEDSFDILRRVMLLASEKGIDVAWDPYQDEDGRVVFTPRQQGGLSQVR